MAKLLRIVTYIFCLAQLGFVISQLLPGIHQNADIYAAILLTGLPIVAICALVTGPDAEEIELTKEVKKARLKHELESLKTEKSQEA